MGDRRNPGSDFRKIKIDKRSERYLYYIGKAINFILWEKLKELEYLHQEEMLRE
ncbi:hypothetical protein CE91St19_03260 [Odoribacter laneus]|nr:hypothetical protein CE91St19_03260 [Odoribacter laneus]GKI24188.1 hypothetical protein CE91St20_03250 [Odoribacter laneus]